MENLKKLLDWLKCFPAWVRVVILVLIAAILAIVSLTSCSATAKMQRSGVHIDTVRVDYIIRSRNFESFSYDKSRPSFYEGPHDYFAVS